MNRKYFGCTVFGCNNEHHAKGKCRKHAHQDWVKKTGYKQNPENLKKYRETLKGQFKLLRENAKARDIDVFLSFEDFSEARATKNCTYCGGALPRVGCGMDRKDSSLPYTKDNIVACCGECNHIKSNTLSHEEMIMIMVHRNEKCNLIGLGC